MNTPPQAVLRKISARRRLIQRPAASPAWTTFLSGSASVDVAQQRLPAVTRPRLLTQRELEVLHLVAHGETDQRIADRLYVSRRTINCHVANILAKLDVPSRTAAAMAAARIGLL
jgi:DNA-binding NarL/FixJ family response regulator